MHNKNNTPKRLHEVDQAKGLAILLVVFGHIVARQPPEGNNWYAILKTAIYSFHMAFFMFLSGLVFFAKLNIPNYFPEYFIFIKKRFLRLMPAYFLFAIIVFFGKLTAQQFGHVDNPVNGFGDLKNIILFPMLSISAFLWYIYALFAISALALAVISLTRGSIFFLVTIGALLLFIPYINFLAIGQITKYFFFFSLGGIVVKEWASFIAFVDKIWIPAMIFMVFLLWNDQFDGHKWIFVALLSIPALLGFCRYWKFGESILLSIGAMSFPIYLMNTIMIGATKAAMLKIWDWNGKNFLFFFPILFISGVIFPMILKKYIFSRIAWLDRITS